MASLKDTQINGSIDITDKGSIGGSKITTVDWFKNYFGKTKPNITELYSGRAGSGNVTLTADWRNFDMLFVAITNDNGQNMTWDWYPTWLLKESINIQKSAGRAGASICAKGAVYWAISTASTGATLTVQTENATLEKVYGINFE